MSTQSEQWPLCRTRHNGHTFATLALQKGISLAAVKKILGHDRLSTTEIYLNLTDIHVQEEYERKW